MIQLFHFKKVKQSVPRHDLTRQSLVQMLYHMLAPASKLYGGKVEQDIFHGKEEQDSQNIFHQF